MPLDASGAECACMNLVGPVVMFGSIREYVQFTEQAMEVLHICCVAHLIKVREIHSGRCGETITCLGLSADCDGSSSANELQL